MARIPELVSNHPLDDVQRKLRAALRNEAPEFVFEELQDEEGELRAALFGPDGTPWCRFGHGLVCLNGETCLNKSHR